MSSFFTKAQPPLPEATVKSICASPYIFILSEENNAELNLPIRIKVAIGLITENSKLNVMGIKNKIKFDKGTNELIFSKPIQQKIFGEYAVVVKVDLNIIEWYMLEIHCPLAEEVYSQSSSVQTISYMGTTLYFIAFYEKNYKLTSVCNVSFTNFASVQSNRFIA